MPDPADRVPQPPPGEPPPPRGDQAETPPLALASIVPTRLICNVFPTDEPTAPYAVFLRVESLNGSFVFGWSPSEARDVARIITETAAAAEKVTGSPSSLIVPNLDAATLERLSRTGR